jgi:hypothetical protein
VYASLDSQGGIEKTIGHVFVKRAQTEINNQADPAKRGGVSPIVGQADFVEFGE